MAHLLRGKQVGIQNDLSAGIMPDFFAIDDVGTNIRSGIETALMNVTVRSIRNKFTDLCSSV